MLPFSLSRAGTLSSDCTTGSFLGLTYVRTCILPLSPGRSGVKLRLECVTVSFLGFLRPPSWISPYVGPTMLPPYLVELEHAKLGA